MSESLERGLERLRDGDPDGVQVLEEAIQAVSNFKHILHADGDIFLSVCVRGMLDIAYWVLESPATSPDVAERIRAAQRLIDDGDEAGVTALEDALLHVD